MLTKAQIDQHNEIGAIVVPDILSADEMLRLRRVTDEFVERARGVTAHNEIYDLEDSHTPDAAPRVRRIKAAHLHHPEYARLVCHPRISAVLQDIWGPDIRASIPPSSTDEVRRLRRGRRMAPGLGLLPAHQRRFGRGRRDVFDDMEMANGPLMIVPGSHRGPIHDHHRRRHLLRRDGPGQSRRRLRRRGPAHWQGWLSITVHHVRAVHGSAPNVSDKDRRLLLFQFRTADAWPLLGFAAGIEKYKELMVCGASTANRGLSMRRCVVCRCRGPPNCKARSMRIRRA